MNWTVLFYFQTKKTTTAASSSNRCVHVIYREAPYIHLKPAFHTWSPENVRICLIPGIFGNAVLPKLLVWLIYVKCVFRSVPWHTRCWQWDGSISSVKGLLYNPKHFNQVVHGVKTCSVSKTESKMELEKSQNTKGFLHVPLQPSDLLTWTCLVSAMFRKCSVGFSEGAARIGHEGASEHDKHSLAVNAPDY